MGSINLSNSKNRDALVHTQSVSTSLRVRWLDEDDIGGKLSPSCDPFQE